MIAIFIISFMMKIKNVALIILDKEKKKSEALLQSQNMMLFFPTFLWTS